MSRQVTELHFH